VACGIGAGAKGVLNRHDLSPLLDGSTYIIKYDELEQAIFMKGSWIFDADSVPDMKWLLHIHDELPPSSDQGRYILL